MPFEASPENVDFELLADYLKALAHPGRLELLWQLRAPTKPAALSIRPHRKDELSPERPVSRQAVETHLAKLQEIGAVKRLSVEGGADKWVTDLPHVFALVEELRKLTAIPAQQLDLEATMEGTRAGSGEWRKGPKVILLSGPWDGRAFPLDGKGPWTVGRSRTCGVSLSYDPFVSAEHATVHQGPQGFTLSSLPKKNPARLNLVPLAPELPRALGHGDVVSLGRTHLVFHER